MFNTILLMKDMRNRTTTCKKFMKQINNIFQYNVTEDMHRKIYEFEREIFYPLFAMTPKSYYEFKKMRKLSKLSVSLVMSDDQIISLIVNEKFTKKHAQTIIIGTKKAYRKKGFIKVLSKMNLNGLNLKGIEYVSFWTSPSSPLIKVYSEYAKCLSTGDKLTSDEIILMNDYLKARKKKLPNNLNRTVVDFYKLKNNTMSPAAFWVYKLGGVHG